MHDAYMIDWLLKSPTQVQFECVTTFGDNLLVGSKQGHLLMYSVTSKPADQKKLDVQLLKLIKTFSKKAINQLAVVPEFEIIISLSDGIVNVHNMRVYNFPVVSSLEKTKGASLFSLDVKKVTSLTGITSVMVRMCVVVKRKLQLFYWKRDKFLDFRDDISVPDIPKAVEWCDDKIVVGFKGEYKLIDISGKQEELFPIKPQEPSVTKLSDRTFALGKDCKTILMNTVGEALQNVPVKWKEPPEAIAFDDPYFIAVGNANIEVKTTDDLLVQQISLPKSSARLICRNRQGFLFVASAAEVWCLHGVPLVQQIRRVLEDKQFELALKLTNISDETEYEKRKNAHEIQTLYAHDLFEKKQFAKSMSEFIKLGTNPYNVIQLYPELLLKPGSDSKASAKMNDRDSEKALLALIEYLTEVRQTIMGKTEWVSEEVDSKKHNLIQIIDTTLLKCYLLTNDALVAPLLRLNRCHLRETETMLKKFQKYRELIILYQTNNMHKCALDLLKEQSQIQESPLQGADHTILYLQQLGNNHIDLILEHAAWVLAMSPEEGFRIFTEDLQEVEQLPRPKVLDFLLREQPNLVIPYLEHVINVWDEKSDIVHNALVYQYRAKIQQLLASNNNDDASAFREKLITFLKTSHHYNPQVVIVQFPVDSLFDERAIVLGRMGMHENAISIFLRTLNNTSKAMEYCENVYRWKQEGYETVYVQLLRMIIDPPSDPFQEMLGISNSTAKPDVEKALSILQMHSNEMPVLGALNVLPDNVPLVRMQKFLHSSFQHKLMERRRVQILKGLLQAEHFQVLKKKIESQSEVMHLTELKLCPVCKKRFSNQSAFARYPNGEIVHYSCQEAKK
ncbi:vam6/Vps39-like protein [Neocloeon triangulifer]|uniref:vam6/Vps39-like protein n=1 Tax=Neocloeon triangulifer TaxID=2078957 RepID=UPI00286F1665|nr:vam6/Vps39-like protein [Neocloeon triangulifer]